MLVDEGVEVPLGLVAVPGQVLVARGYRDAPFQLLFPEVGQETVEVVPVDGDLAVWRKEGQPVLEDGQIGDDEPAGALYRCRELEGDVRGRSSNHVADHDVYLGEVLVVVVDYHHGAASGEALGLHLFY